MLSDAQLAIMGKDLQAVRAVRMMWLPMVILPVVFGVVLPVGLLLGVHFGQDAVRQAEQMLKSMHLENTFGSPQEAILTIMVDQMFPALFLILPLMGSTVLGANSLVGERERRTMETLLYGPITMRELFVAKAAGALIPALMMMLGTVLVFGTIMDVGAWLLLGIVPFPSWKWAVMVVWVAPGVALLALTALVAVSAKATSSQEAQQVAAMVVLPIVLLVAGQATGLLLLNVPVLVGAGAILWVLDVLLLRAVARRFTRESLL